MNGFLWQSSNGAILISLTFRFWLTLIAFRKAWENRATLTSHSICTCIKAHCLRYITHFIHMKSCLNIIKCHYDRIKFQIKLYINLRVKYILFKKFYFLSNFLNCSKICQFFSFEFSYVIFFIEILSI